MTRILTITNMYPPHHLGGYELSCRDVMDRLRARGHEITVLTTDMRVPGVVDPTGEVAAGVRRDLLFYWEDHALLNPPPRRRAGIERHNQRQLAVALEQARPEVASIWNMGAMSLGLLTTLARAEVPLVLVVCDDWLCYGPDLDPWTRMFRHRPRLAALTRRITGVPTGLPDVGQHATFCFISEYIRGRARAEGHLPVVDSTIVYSGIDTVDFPVLPAPPADRPWRGELYYAGRLDVRKGVETLIRAFAKLPSPGRLTFDGRGEGAYQAHLEAMARDLGVGDRVSFTVSARVELAGHYEAADAVVFPVEWDEPFGLVPVEAMARGTPVVATGTGGSAEFLRGGENCVLFPPGDDAALVAALERLAGDVALQGRVVAGGLATASELTIDRLAAVLEEWHVGAATGFRAGRPAERHLRL